MLRNFGSKINSQPIINEKCVENIINVCEQILEGDQTVRIELNEGISPFETKLVQKINILIAVLTFEPEQTVVSASLNQKSIDQYLTVISEICHGNFEARIMNIPEEECIERNLSVHLNEMIDRTDAYVRESTACLDFISRNLYHRRIAENGMVGAFGRATKKINEAADSVEIKINKFYQQVDRMNEISSELNESATSMATIVSSANELVVNVASGAEEASVNTQTVSAAAEELSVTVGEINQQMTNAADMTTSAFKEAQGANDLMSKLLEASSEIGQVINLINEVAAQTNLLALNATIEAARAGEAGKGFAVVASEVKALASQTRTATENIKKQISEIQLASGKAVDAINQITSSIGDINEVSTSVSAAVEEQGAATKEIARNVQEAASGVDEISSNINGVARNVNEVKKSAENVKNISIQLADQSKELQSILIS